jgi:hypothetical protein
MSTINIAIILLALVAANLPWFSERLFYLIPLRNKHLGWRLLELLVLYFFLGGITYMAERYTAGQVAAQHWEFYATTVSLFIVFAFPGFIWRYLWRK